MMRMEDAQLDEMLHNICDQELPDSDIVNEKMEEAYTQIRSAGAGRNQVKRHWGGKIAAAACLILVLGLGAGAANPSVAAEIPVIGKIFSYLEGQVSFPGNYSENAVPVEKNTTAEGEASPQGTQSEEGTLLMENSRHESGNVPSATEDDQNSGADYTCTSGDLSVTITEISGDGNYLYAAVRVENRDDFPQDFLNTESNHSTDYFYCKTSAVLYHKDGSSTAFSEETGNIPAWSMEGRFQDKHTFVGIMMLELEDMTDCSKVELNFHDFQKDLSTTHMVEAHAAGEKETVMVPENDRKVYEGSWKFVLEPGDIKPVKEVVVNESNEQGLGVARVVKSIYEVYAELILPPGKSEADYVVTIWDGDGKPMESHGNTVEHYATFERNTDQVTIYVLDEDTYFNECKGNNAYKQPEMALYSVTVTF